MNRIRMLEKARDQRDHYRRLHLEAVSQLPKLQAARDEIKRVFDAFDHHRGVQGKVSYLLSEYADSIDVATMEVDNCEKSIEKWRDETELWALAFDGLRQLWPDVKLQDRERHEL